MPALLAMLVGAALAPPAPAGPSTALIDAVWVAFRCKASDCVKGTAFHIGGGVFYTNAHVAQVREGYGPLTLARGTSPRVILGTAAILCLNERAIASGDPRPYDIAKVKLEGTRPLPPALTTTRNGPVAHAHITIIGYPGPTWTPVVATGTVEQILPLSVFAYTVDSGLVAQGSSGSPILNSQNEVVGIEYASDDQGEYQFAVTLDFADQVCTPTH